MDNRQRQYISLLCKNCERPVSRQLARLTPDEWTRWANGFCTAKLRVSEYDTIPLVPFGTMAHLAGTTDSPMWGESAFFSVDMLGERPAESSCFLAPHELFAELRKPWPGGCCGPMATLASTESLFCACGSALGWLEDDCTSRASFVRVNLDRVIVRESDEYSWPPVLSEGDFDEQLFEIAARSDGGFDHNFGALETSRVWELWELVSMLSSGSLVVRSGDSSFWSYNPAEHSVKIFDSAMPTTIDWDADDFGIPCPSIKVPEERFWEHLRCALSVEMGFVPFGGDADQGIGL